MSGFKKGPSWKTKGLALLTVLSITCLGLASSTASAAENVPQSIVDSTFGKDGNVITNLGGSDVANSTAIQQDGKIIVAGHSDNDFALARYNTGGDLDTSFDTDGTVTTNFGGTDYGYSVAVQTDGKIILAGFSNVNGNYDFALARYNTDGSLDTSFDTDGTVTTDLGGDDYGYSVAVQT
ncbi:MAG: delta-60 repeat domain-containing protein, partial [Actinomycetota bacterium]